MVHFICALHKFSEAKVAEMFASERCWLFEEENLLIAQSGFRAYAFQRNSSLMSTVLIAQDMEALVLHLEDNYQDYDATDAN